MHPTVRKKVLPASTQDGKDKISVRFEILAKLLNEAEKDRECAAESEDGIPELFRKRKRTPSEELSDPREERFTQLESADRRRTRKTIPSGNREVGAQKDEFGGEHAKATAVRRSARMQNVPKEHMI